jgi:class 3 adenylate cyclase
VAASVSTFLIADIRGYTRFTEEYGDEAAARLAAKFKDIVEEVVTTRAGRVVEIRGDEALTVFQSARQAIRAAMDLQRFFAEETDADQDLPLRVGIGIDSGEAVEMGDGSFRGASLNVAARLCGLAHGEEVLVSEGTTGLAGRLPGLRYVDRGRLSLKGVGHPVHAYRVAWEEEKESRSSVVMFFSNSGRLAPKIVALVVLIAAATAAVVVYLTTGTGNDSNAAPRGALEETGTTTTGSTTQTEPAALDLAAVVPPKLWSDCQVQTVPEQDAEETAVCIPPQTPQKFAPDRWQVSIYPDGATLRRVYADQRETHRIEPDSGRCTRFSWGGERPWLHGPGQPGGRAFCYFDGDDAVIVWSHERLGQDTHRDILAVAREAGSDHAGLALWWKPWHHLIGKANQ